MKRSMLLLVMVSLLILCVVGSCIAATITVQAGRLGTGYDPTRWFVQIRCDGWGYQQGWISSVYGWTFRGLPRNGRVWVQVIDAYEPWGSRREVQWVGPITNANADYRLRFFRYD